MNKGKGKREMMQILLLIGILLIAITAFVYCEKKPKKIVYKKCVKEKLKTTKQIKKQENILFLGDSITEYYPIDSIYKDLPIVKSGVAGYRTKDILDRMQTMVYQYNPTKIFLLIGTNDIVDAGEEEKEKTINNIKEIIEKIKENRKKATIYLESIYPVNKGINKKVVENRDNNTIQEINKELKDYCKKNNIKYIDMYKELKDEDDNFSKDYTDDGLHPNSLGYARISQVRIKEIYDIK